MTTSVDNVETRFLPGIFLFLFGLFGLYGDWIPFVARSNLMITGFQKMIALSCGYCSIVVMLCSTVDHMDKEEAVGAFRLVGRWFMWGGVFLAAFAIGLVVTDTRYPDDLLHVGKLASVCAIASMLFSVCAYCLLRKRPKSKSRDSVSHGKLKSGFAVVLCIVAGVMLYQRNIERLERNASYDAQDEDARRRSKPWLVELDSLHGGMTVQDFRALTQKEGHAPNCYSNLRSEERVKPDDKTACWIMVGNIWGISARSATFTFGDDGLRSHFLRFPESSWDMAQQKLDADGQKLPQTFGIDHQTRAPVFGWRFSSGLAFAAAPAPGSELTILWTAKENVARDHCPFQGTAARRDPSGYSVPVSRLWPEIDCTKFR